MKKSTSLSYNKAEDENKSSKGTTGNDFAEKEEWRMITSEVTRCPPFLRGEGPFVVNIQWFTLPLRWRTS